jgi:hypothetical protein
MASNTNKTILVAVNGAQRPIEEAPVVTAAVMPGHLLNVTATGVAGLASAGAVNRKAFALENPAAADPTLPAISQSYAVGDTCRFVYAQGGDLVYAHVASGNNVAFGDVLVASATAGHLAKATVDATTLAGALVGFAEEAVNATAAAARIKIRVA